MIVIAFIVLIFQALTLAGVLTLMEEKDRKAGEKRKKHVYRKMSEPEARRILRDLANEMMITAEETAAIDTALAHSWRYLDGPCEYDNPEIRFPEEEIKAYLENGQRYKGEEGAGNGKF
jgi:hypothetical protein